MFLVTFYPRYTIFLCMYIIKVLDNHCPYFCIFNELYLAKVRAVASPTLKE